ESTSNVLEEWFQNGKLETIINENVFNMKADKSEVDALSSQLEQITKVVGKPSGVDDTINIQTAIDIVHDNGGGSVQLGDGDYLFSDDIHIKKGVHLIGNGKGTWLKTTNTQLARFVFYEQSGMKNVNVQYPHGYNDTALYFANRYLTPLTGNQTVPASGTENVRVYLENVYLKKPSNYGSEQAVGLELYSEGKVEHEVYSGYWGVNTKNIMIDWSHTAHYIHADLYGWVNECTFDTTTVDKCNHFLVTKKREGSLGIDYNHFV